MPRVILASASPRRKELLAQLVPDFEVFPASLDERAFAHLDPFAFVKRLAHAKAHAIWRDRRDSIVIGADTVVARQYRTQWRQFGKPSDPAEACRILKELSGCRHFVVTGYCVMTPQQETTNWAATEVQFRRLSVKEIEAYVATGEPMDKAGAYAIQGGAKDFVVSIEGSLSNVIGLPLEKLAPILRELLQAP